MRQPLQGWLTRKEKSQGTAGAAEVHRALLERLQNDEWAGYKDVGLLCSHGLSLESRFSSVTSASGRGFDQTLILQG